MATQAFFDRIYQRVYFVAGLALVAVTILQAFNGAADWISYGSKELKEKLAVNVEEFLQEVPVQYKANILYFEFKERCSEEDGTSYHYSYVLPTVCIDVDLELPPYYWKASIYHELGHEAWYHLTREDEEIYKHNNATGRLTSPYSEKSVKEGFAEDFMYYNQPMALYGPQANNTKEFLGKITARILS